MHLKAGYGLDADGFIVSDVSIDKIDPVYWPCIQESIERINKEFQQQLHSVYVYGSVARGEAVAAKSDLDLIALFNEKLDDRKKAEMKHLAEQLSHKYHALVRDVGIAVADYDYTMDPANYYENAFIKEISVCVYGEDLGRRFGPYKLTPEIPISFNGDIGDVLSRTLKRLQTADKEALQTLTQNLSRKLIRTYYSMVMVRAQIWTTRLFEQAEVFLDYFPAKEPLIRTLLDWIEKPPTDRDAVLAQFRTEGTWASDLFIREAKCSGI